jgi:hypothetical protein
MASAEAFVADKTSTSWTISIPLMGFTLFSKKKTGGGGEQSSGQPSSSSTKLDTKEARANTEKLKGYHDLSKVTVAFHIYTISSRAASVHTTP